MNPLRPAPSARPGLAAFTLLEVILALSIATALLIVALLFYRQATDLRGQILQQSEQLTSARLLVDRLAADLREALPEPNSFSGGPESLSLVRLAGAHLTNAGRVRIHFQAVRSLDGTNEWITGIDRREDSLNAPRSRPVALLPSFTGSNSLTADFSSADPSAFASTNATAQATPDTVTGDLHYLRFRYWDGAAWLSGWTNASPPPGVEVIVGIDPPETEALETPGDGELGFSAGSSATASSASTSAPPPESAASWIRRVVFLPSGVAQRTAAPDLFSSPLAP
jgi:type II secretory pathway pseudopilin PulG